jgi:exosortase B
MPPIDLKALQRGIASASPTLLMVALGLAVLYLPTLSDQISTHWTTPDSAHAPLVLGVSAWFAWQRLGALRRIEGCSAPVLGGVVFVVGLVLYVVGRSQALDTLEVGSLIPVGAGLLLIVRGWPGLRLMAFPLFFLFFLVPLPSALVQALTTPLKTGVSWLASELMVIAGYPIARSGVVLNVGQYQLLVADACAGLSSIFTLEALALVYLQLVPSAAPWRKWALGLLAVPIAFMANTVRVIVLIAVTYHLGDEAGQGFTHDFAGMLLFIVAVILLLAVDNLLVLGQGLRNRRIGRNAAPAT